MGEFPPLLSVRDIQKRLLAIFPEGTPNRGYCTREIAAKTVFVMLYIGAVEGVNRLRPDQVTRMTDLQAAKADDESRRNWARASLARRMGSSILGRWYAVNSREPIRDETLREGLVPTGAVLAAPDLPTTSALPRYSLSRSFVALFDPALKGKALANAIARWQAENLSAGALARIALVGKGATASARGVLVAFPNGETRRLVPGPSAVITKVVIEEFAPRFLKEPGVIFLSESGNKVVARDEQLAESIGLNIPADRYLPDGLLVDLGPKDPLLVFVEVVATDGPINAKRKEAFLQITRAAGFADRQVAFVTAYLDRGQPAFKRTMSELAWNSFAWFASEPANIVVLYEGAEHKRARLIDLL
jgi:hypothetical protein